MPTVPTVVYQNGFWHIESKFDNEPGLYVYKYKYHYKSFHSYLYEPKSLIPSNSFTIIVNMTRHNKRRTGDRLGCTISAIIDTFEMTNKREPTRQEFNYIIMTTCDRGSRLK